MSATLNPSAQRAAPKDLILSADAGSKSRHAMALADIKGGLKLWRLGLTLGWLDIKLKYRGSMLGPFWLTLSTAVMIGALGAVYGTLFHINLHDYLPFLALSLVLWNALGGLVGEACYTFTQADSLIRSARMPFFVHAIRVVVRTVLTLLHNVVVIVIVFALFRVWPGSTALYAFPGLLLWFGDAFAVCLLLGTICARFRDIPQIVQSIMQMAFYVTPVVWRREQLGSRGWWLEYNPFYDLLEVVRGPMLGANPDWMVWSWAIGFSVLVCGLTWMLFARVRGRVAFWV